LRLSKQQGYDHSIDNNAPGAFPILSHAWQQCHRSWVNSLTNVNDHIFIRQRYFLKPKLGLLIDVRLEPPAQFDREGTMQQVLIVDDDRLVADTLTLIFERNGFAAKTAYSADEALESSRQFTPDLLLCDVTMPGRDGLSLVEDITRELPACRILVLTGFYSNLTNVREQARKLSRPLGILTKPCQPSELLREAAALLATA
jgi:CheY-like chemotaxis protein